ncbi:MAG: deoxyribonuclease HsdR [Bacteroidetes bacterium HGW-Bacteroidetes-6]|jgi:Do/DeqQ family serine protease|nr:MAG: deoxyribonuclease HsdR [Bacteroidetes bacterium HGW-Bacteroidetes-6]
MKAKTIFLNVVFGFVGSLVALGGVYGVLRSGSEIKPQLPQTNERVSVQTVSQSAAPTDFTEAAGLAVPSVVHIKTTFSQKNESYDNFFNPFYDFFNMQTPYGKQYPVIGTGSGVIVGADGYIVTNNHVVRDAQEIVITLNDKREFKASIVGTDPSTDLALVKIEASDLPYLIFGNSDDVKVGEWVLAVGNPFNLTSTVTAGIISAKARNINILGGGSSVESFLQTDAVVNPGNSGGALVNTRGELIGINAAIASNTGSYSGYSFAIPSNIARKVVNDLMQYGMVQRAYLGADVAEVDAETARKYGLTEVRGVLVTSVNQGGSAFEAGIDAGDVILSIDEIEVNSSSRMLEIIAERQPGDNIKVQIRRNGKLVVKTVKLQNRKGETQLLSDHDNDVVSILGATFEEPSSDEFARLRLKNGLKISEMADGVLKRAGIKEGFIVTKIDGNPINSLSDLEAALSGKTGGILMEGIYPNGMKAYYGFGL